MSKDGSSGAPPAPTGKLVEEPAPTGKLVEEPTKPEAPAGASPERGLSRVAITREAAIDWVNEEVKAQSSCRSLPFTFIFWLIFVLTTYGHMQVSISFEIKGLIKETLTSALNVGTASTAVNASNATTRRLAAAGGKSGGASSTTRAGDGNRIRGMGLTEVKAPAKIYDWVEATLVRLAWSDTVEGTSFVNYFNRVIGGARLMQTRLETKECPGNWELTKYFKSVCYSLGSDLNKSSLGNSTWQGFSPNQEGVFSYWLDIHQTEAEVLAHVDFLRNYSWLDVATEDLKAQIVLYNDQVALFAFAEVTFHLERNGQLAHRIEIKVLPTQVYNSPITIIGDVLLCLLLAWQFVGELIKLYRRCKYGGMKFYFRSAYTYVNWAVVVLGIGLASFFIYLVVELDNMSDDFREIPDPPTGVQYLPGSNNWSARQGQLDGFFGDMSSMSQKLAVHEFITFWYTLVLMAKFFEAFSANPRLAVITETFLKSFKDLFHFMIVFLAIFFNFALGAYFIFGHHLEEWSNLVLALITSLRALMGDFDFARMYRVAPISACIWFVAFMWLIFIVMLNMFLAIIMDVYANVKESNRNESSLWVQARRFLTRPNASEGHHWKLAETDQLLTAKQRLEKLNSEEELHEMTTEDLVKIGIPHSLAEEMVRSLRQEGLVADDQIKVEGHKEAEVPIAYQGKALTPAFSNELDTVTAGMRVLLDRLEMIEDGRPSTSNGASPKWDGVRGSPGSQAASKGASGEGREEERGASGLPGSLNSSGEEYENDSEESEEFV